MSFDVAMSADRRGGAARRRRRLLALPISLAAHAAVGLAIYQARPEPLAMYEEQALALSLVEPRLIVPPPPPPQPEPEPAPDAAEPADPAPPSADAPVPTPSPDKPKPLRKARLAKVVPPDVAPLFAGKAQTDAVGVADTIRPGNGLSDGEIAGARTAGSGGSGGGCDMVELLQKALRRDAEVQAAIAREHAALAGKAINLWAGDWVRSSGQEGKGLAGVRQAIIMEVGFAPAACRNETVNGRVLISMSDRPGAPRIVLGSDAWRWNHLLHAEGAVRSSRYGG
ncbi:MAG: hypothetical protein RBS50_05960 [Phenylobacterium sp.]|uniref:hypothetical protein n=1 Tax=Phenylobacterium sp. TaxID=1871053 RepID=UPI002A36D5C2|nr:hypothetical protein [Phenylobacterium sp.]MDX9997483.1 hypothetical protein [Phenylobacterium sp.]